MKKLLFLAVNSSYSHASLALTLLHHACRELKEWQWHRLELTVEDDPAETAEKIVAETPDVVTASLYLFNRTAVLNILNRVKKLRPAVRIAVGGPEVLGDGAEKLLASSPFIDTVFRGEGEEHFPGWLAAFDPAEARRVIPAGGNAVFQNWAKEEFPADDPFLRFDRPFLQYETARGCPLGCGYCTSGNTLLRQKSIGQVQKELHQLAARGAKEIRLLDRTFNLPCDRGAALLKLFREDFPGLHFHLEIHPQFLDDAMRRELALSHPGQLHLEAGIQSLDERVQQSIGRKSDPGKALEGLKFLTFCSNFETHVDLLCGLPGQSFGSLLRDLDTLLEAAPAEIQLEVLKILPGTAMCADNSLIHSDLPPYDVMQTSGMNANEILTSRLLSKLLDLTYNHPALHDSLVTARREKSGFFPELLNFFQTHGLGLRRLYDLKRRFELLMQFFEPDNYPETQFELACGWLRSGYPAGEGAAVRAERIAALPPGAQLIAGAAGTATARETRFFAVAGRKCQRIFGFNRRFTMNLPAAEWENKQLSAP